MGLGEKSLFWDKPDKILTPEELEYYQYSGQDLANYYECMYTTGITPQMAVSGKNDNPSAYIGSSLSVTAGYGLQVIVSPGTAMIKGRPYLLSLPLVFTLSEGAVTDIFLQSNAQQEKPEIKIVARKRPTGETVTDNAKRESLIYEIALATVEIPSASIQVTPLMLTDQRLNATLHLADGKPISGLCQSIPKVNTLGIWEDYHELDVYIKAVWKAFITDSNTEWRTFIADNTSEWNEFLSVKRNDFDVWFETIQNILSEDVASKLAADITRVDGKTDQNAAAIATLSASLPTTSTRTTRHTLTASRWQASGEAFVQVITLAASVAEDVTVEIGEVSEGMTLDKLEAIGAAMLTPTASTANTITVTAFGEKPEIDIPVFVTVFGLFKD